MWRLGGCTRVARARHEAPLKEAIGGGGVALGLNLVNEEPPGEELLGLEGLVVPPPALDVRLVLPAPLAHGQRRLEHAVVRLEPRGLDLLGRHLQSEPVVQLRCLL